MVCSCTIFKKSSDSPTVFIPRVEDMIGAGKEDLVGELVMLAYSIIVLKDAVVHELGFWFPQEVLEDKGFRGYFPKFGNREVRFKDGLIAVLVREVTVGLKCSEFLGFAYR